MVTAYSKMLLKTCIDDPLWHIMLLFTMINADDTPVKNQLTEYNTNFQYYNPEDANAVMQYEERSNFKIKSYPENNRQPRQIQNQKPSGYSSSFLNRLNTHGVAISGNIGIGIRYASGNNYNGGNQQHHQESSSNIFDRYLGTTFNIGSNLHLANNEEDQTGAQSSYGHGINSPIKSDDAKRLGFLSDNSTSRQNSLWKRLGNYFTKNKDSNNTNEECPGFDEFENCTEITTNNIFTRLFSRYFLKNEPRKEYAEATDFHVLLQNMDPRNETNVINNLSKLNKYFNKYRFSSIFEQLWSDRNNIDQNNTSAKNDYDTFRSTVRDFLVNKLASYISQNSSNENFLQKLVKRSLSQMTNETQSESTNSPNERNTLVRNLSKYFTNDKIKVFFPDIETIRTNLTHSQWLEDENGYAISWLKYNYPGLVSKYFSLNNERNDT